MFLYHLCHLRSFWFPSSDSPEEIEDYEEEVTQEVVASLPEVTEKKEKNTSFFSVALGAGVALAVLTAIYHKKK